MTNCTIIGLNSGVELNNDADGVIIIGDNIKNLDKSQLNVLFLNDKIAIGTHLMGTPINLKEVIEKYIHNRNDYTQTSIGNELS